MALDTYDTALNKNIDIIVMDKSSVVGEICVITNVNNGKQYVGQTVSHRKNHGKYRPFGYVGRFKDHLSEAICNTKTKQCGYLNNAIRKHGADAFKVDLIKRCELCNLDEEEKVYIAKYNTMFPNGYNLTIGGKTTKCVNVQFSNTIQEKKKRIKVHTDESKNNISQSLRKLHESTNEFAQIFSQHTKTTFDEQASTLRTCIK